MLYFIISDVTKKWILLCIQCDVDAPPGGFREVMLHSCEHDPLSRCIWGDALQNLQEVAPLVQ